MKAIKRVLVSCVIFGSLLIIWQAFSWVNFLTTPLIPAGQTQIIELKQGSGLFSLTKELESRGLLQHRFYFEWLARLTGVAKHLRAGEYELTSGMRPQAVLELLTSGKVIEHELTIIEGWNINQVLAALAKHPALHHTLTGLTLVQIKERLAIPEPYLEGIFFPSTYRFAKGTTDIAFLRRAYELMQNNLMAEWASRQPDLPYQTPYQALIAASLIEKEAKLSAERALVGGVIVKRLQIGMRLQIDASVIYGLADTYTGKLHKSEMRKDTPYNTYVYKGLPPTPIAMPGLASIKAALHPVITGNIFYVAKGDGGHYFSENLSEHNKAIQQSNRNKQVVPKVEPQLAPAACIVNEFSINNLLPKCCSSHYNLVPSHR